MSGENVGTRTGFANPFACSHRAVVVEANNEALGWGINKIELEIDGVQSQLIKILEEGGEDVNLSLVTEVGGTNQEKAGKIVDLNSKLSGYLKARNEKEAALTILNQNAVVGDDADPGWGGHLMQPAMSIDHEWASRQLRSQFQERYGDHSLKEMAGRGHGVTLDMDIPGRDINNALFKRTAGWDPFVKREPSYVPSIQRQVRLFDILPISATDQSAVEYMEETTFTNTAKATAEGGAAPDASLVLTKRSVPVEKYAVSIAVTEEQLDDVPEVDSYLNDRLPFMLMLKVEEACMTGTGLSPLIKGFTKQTGVLNYALKTTNNQPSKLLHDILEASYKVKNDGIAFPDAVYCNLNFVKGVYLSETSSGGFYLGNPQTGFRPEVWGLPLVETHMFTWEDSEIVGLIGAFGMWSKLRIRRGYQLDVGYSSDDFLKGQMRIRGTVRLVLVVYRPKAFCTFTWPLDVSSG